MSGNWSELGIPNFAGMSLMKNPAKYQGYSLYRFWVIQERPKGGRIKSPPPPQVRVKSLIRKLQDLCFRACNPSLYFLANHCGYQFSEVLTEVFLRILMFSVHWFTFCSSKFHKYIIRGTHAIQVITGEIRLFDFT